MDCAQLCKVVMSVAAHLPNIGHPPVEAGGGLRLTLRSCASRLVLWCSGRLAAELNGEAVQLEASGW